MYEESHICAFVSNGPINICYFNRNIRYLFVETGLNVDGDPPHVNRIGIGVGRTPPFANHFQNWIWAGQDADIFMDEFVAMGNHIEQSRVDGSYESKLDPVAENREPMEVLAKRISRFVYSPYKPVEHDVIFECLKYCPPGIIEHCDTQLILAEIYLWRRELGASKCHYLKAVTTINPPKSWPLAQLGMICELQSNDDEAIEFYERAIQIDQRLSPVHYRMGALTQKQGDMDIASRHFQLSIERGDSNQQNFAKLNELLELLKQLDKQNQPDLFSNSCRSVIKLWRVLNSNVAQ